MTRKKNFKLFDILLLLEISAKSKDTLDNINVSSVCNLHGTWIKKLILLNSKLET